MTDDPPADDDGGKAHKAMEICDAVIDRCWDLLTEDSVVKKLTPAELNDIMQATATAWSLATSIIGTVEEPEDEDDE